MLICNRGHKHTDSAYCETADCKVCVDDRSCDVASFVDAVAADCQRTINSLDAGHLTGFTRRAVAALVHLREAWTVADPSNAPGIERSIASLFSTRSFREQPDSYLEYLYWGMGDEQADKLDAAFCSAAHRLITPTAPADDVPHNAETAETVVAPHALRPRADGHD